MDALRLYKLMLVFFALKQLACTYIYFEKMILFKKLIEVTVSYALRYLDDCKLSTGVNNVLLPIVNKVMLPTVNNVVRPTVNHVMLQL